MENHHIQWKPIIGFENFYTVSNTGKVWSKYYKKLLKPEINNGYYRVTLSINKKTYHHSIHRLVATAFIPNHENKTQVNHKDENTLNNNVKNLEWVSPRQNTIYKCGENKYGKNKTTPVIQFTLNGEKIKRFSSISEAYKKTGVGITGISLCCKNTLKTAGGFKWEYEDIYICPEGSIRIEGFGDRYKITEWGTIYNTELKRYLKQQKDKNGYRYVKLYHNKRRVAKMVHVLVAEAFIPNPDSKPVVNHKDSNKSNNMVNNLEWATHTENSICTVKNGNGRCRPVLQLDMDNNIVAKYDSIVKAARETGLSQKTIQAVCKKYNGRKSHGGYKWEYNT